MARLVIRAAGLKGSVGFLAIAYDFVRVFSEDEETIAMKFATLVSRALRKAAG